MLSKLPQDKQLILFDGVCNLCNSSVLFVIKRDIKNTFVFAPLQSEVGHQIIEKFNINTDKTDSILLYDISNNKIYERSTAALRIAKRLTYPTKLLSLFLVLPAFMRNWVYNYIAKNRYKWFGKKDACMIPTPELRSKFVQ